MHDGEDCSSLSWEVDDPYGTAYLTGLDCGEYEFLITSEYIADKTYKISLPCDPISHDINNGEINDIEEVTVIKDVGFISVLAWDNDTMAAQPRIANAQVKICTDYTLTDCETVSTNTEGYARKLVDEGTYYVFVSHPDYRPCQVVQAGGVCSVAPYTVQIPPSASFSIRLVKLSDDSSDFFEWLTGDFNIWEWVKIFMLLGLFVALYKIIMALSDN